MKSTTRLDLIFILIIVKRERNKMFKLTKMTRSKYWHIKDDTVNETLCGKSIKSTWKDSIKISLPVNVCSACESYLDVPASANVTDGHSSW